MVDKKKPETFEEQGQHAAARKILRKHYNDEIKRASAAHLNIVYAQSQIDYDREHRPENKKDIPRFEKAKAENEKALSDSETRAMELRESLTALGEVFTDEDKTEAKKP